MDPRIETEAAEIAARAVYFPLIVDEALLVEPTPYTTPVRRLDEAAAARRPVVRQPL
jgi:glycine cleavage system protein P-like pyridoxal-binding family